MKGLDLKTARAILQQLPKLSPSAVKVGIALAGRMNKNGKCWPSYAQIMQDTGLTKRNTIAEGLKQLEAMEVISKKRRRQKTTVYSRFKKYTEGELQENQEVSLGLPEKYTEGVRGNNTKKQLQSLSCNSAPMDAQQREAEAAFEGAESWLFEGGNE